MNIIELIHDLINGANEMGIQQDYDNLILYDSTPDGDFIDYEEAEELIRRRLMTREDLKILENNIEGISDDLAIILKKSDKYKGDIGKIEDEIVLALRKYKLSSSYTTYFAQAIADLIISDREDQQNG